MARHSPIESLRDADAADGLGGRLRRAAAEFIVLALWMGCLVGLLIVAYGWAA